MWPQRNVFRCSITILQRQSAASWRRAGYAAAGVPGPTRKFQGPITAVQSAATADLTQSVNPGEVDVRDRCCELLCMLLTPCLCVSTAAVSQIQQQSAAWTAADFQGNEQALQSARQQAAAAVQSLQSIRVQLGALMQEQTLALNLTNGATAALFCLVTD